MPGVPRTSFTMEKARAEVACSVQKRWFLQKLVAHLLSLSMLWGLHRPWLFTGATERPIACGVFCLKVWQFRVRSSSAAVGSPAILRQLGDEHALTSYWLLEGHGSILRARNRTVMVYVAGSFLLQLALQAPICFHGFLLSSRLRF